ncbi:MAG: outer membrane protein [Halocynthiibacter sp.]
MRQILRGVFAVLLVVGFASGEGRAGEDVSLSRFNGKYVGATAGYGNANARFTIANIPIFDSDVDGSLFGLYFGQGWQNGSRYLGYEISAGYSGVVNGRLSPVGGTPWIRGEIERVWGISLLAKAGAVVGQDKKTLVYGLVGPAIVRVEARAALNGVGQVSGAVPYPGLAVGLGVERFISDQLSIRFQGQYTYYYKADDLFGGVAVQEYNLDTAALSIGLTWRFGD